VTVDLQANEIRYSPGGGQSTVVGFSIDEYTRWRLLEGLDDVGLTERHLDEVERFEAARPSFLPKALPAL